MEVFSYFCPFSKKFNSCEDFKKLTGGQKALTVFVTILSSIFSAPFLGLGGVATFRAMVEKYTFNKIDPNPPENKKDDDSPKSVKTARKTHKFVSLDDGFIGMNPKYKKNLYGIGDNF